MHVNVKMIPVETVPGIREGDLGKSSGGMNPSMIHLIHFKNLCKCHIVPPPSTKTTTIIIKPDPISIVLHTAKLSNQATSKKK
jgi:hypothetical protein